MAIVNTKSTEASQIATDSYQILKHRSFFGMMIGELESLGLTDVSDSHGLDRGSAWKNWFREHQVKFKRVYLYALYQLLVLVCIETRTIRPFERILSKFNK